MSSKITAIPIVDYGAGNARKSTWVTSENPVFLRKSHGAVAGVSGRSRGTFWQRNKRIIVPSVIVIAIVVAVATGVGVSRSASRAAENAAAASGTGTGLTGGEASAAPTPLANPSLLAPSPAVLVPSASASASAAASVSSAATTTASSTAAPSASQSTTASATPSPTALPLPSTIAVSTNASSVELWSARMLSERLGFPLTYWRPDLPAPAAGSPAAIAVGYAAAVRAGVAPQQLNGLSKDGFLLTNRRERGLLGGSLAVSSGPSPSARGSMYGAYRLLREIGFGFYAINATRIPPKPYALQSQSGVDILEQPYMYLRDISSGTVQDNRLRIRGANGSVTFPRVNLSAALGLNGANVNLPVGGYEGASEDDLPGFDATAYVLLSPTLNADAANCAGPGYPPEVHEHNSPCPQVVRDHPDWFVCRINSNTVVYPCGNTTLAGAAYMTQPCWSVPSVQARMIDAIHTIMRLKPSTSVVSIDNMDGQPTICPPDEALNVLENCTGGANFHAVNAIAANLSVHFPGLVVQTLGYNGAQAPPKHLRLRDNVQIRWAPGNINQFLPLTHPDNAAAFADAQGWMVAARSGTIWDNCDNFAFTLAPFPNYFTLPTHIKELAALGFTGFYAAGVPLQGPDMMDLKTFVVAHTMWDPLRANVTALAEEFAAFVYGPQAAPGILAYMTTMEASFRDNDKSFDYKGYKGVRGASRRITIWNAVYSNSTMIACGRLLKGAEAAAATQWHKDNVRQAMLPVQYVVLMRWAQLRLYATNSSTPWPFAPSAAEEFALFNATFTRTKVYSVQQFDEYPAIAQYGCDLLCLRQHMLGY